MPDGRLANPDCSLGTDPRSDPRMVQTFAAFGIDALLPELPVTADSPLDDRLALTAGIEEAISTVFDAIGQATKE
jgi:acetyl esterase